MCPGRADKKVLAGACALLEVEAAARVPTVYLAIAQYYKALRGHPVQER